MKVNIGPVTRLEGHLSVITEVENQVIVDAKAEAEMYRGFELFLQGRDPLDAQQITQRICGVCPYAHGIAASYAQENAYHMPATPNGRILHNLIQGANHLYDYLLHFYQLSALDFIDITAILKYSGNDADLNNIKSWVKLQLDKNDYSPAAPFLPRLSGNYITNTEINITAVKHYVESLKIQQKANQACTIFGGKFPHSTAVFPTGSSQEVTIDKIIRYQDYIRQVKDFIHKKYLPDIAAVSQIYPEYWKIGKTTGGFLSYGLFPLNNELDSERLFSPGVLIEKRMEKVDFNHIQEYTKYSRYASPSGQKVHQGSSIPDAHKQGAYSWSKAPRYQNYPMEVGPSSRVMVDYFSEGSATKPLVDSYAKKLGISVWDMNSVLGRHLSRGLCAALIADFLLESAEKLVPKQKNMKKLEVPASGSGFGVTEASRGALMHYIEIKNYKIKNYQCVVPTTWNISPKDDNDVHGPIETALIGTKVTHEKQQIEAGRIIRSFDPCLACSVH